MARREAMMSQTNPIAQLLPGTQLYKYRLKHRIGGGSFGEVWLAEDQAIAHEYAIKILKPGTPIHQRLREAHIGHALDHNNLVRVHQADVIKHAGSDLVIIAMDYMPRGPVTKLANPSHFLPLPDVVRYGMDILRGLEHLHSQNFFHNDVKPENILIGPQAQGMLTDYGIVGISKTGAPIPPPNCYKIHAAPEVVNNQGITAQTDVFQTGLTLFRMLVGLDLLRQKFNSLGEKKYYNAICQAKLVSPADFPAYVPARLRRIVLKALSPDLNDRYATALDMRRDLEKLNYSGYWTVESNGEFVGHSSTAEFRFDQVKKGSNRFDVIATKKVKASGRETRISAFCAKDCSNAESKKFITKFVKSVMDGI